MILDGLLPQLKNPTRFQSAPVLEADLAKMLEGARWAPSADNFQVWRFLVITSPEGRDTIHKVIAAQDPRLQGAPPKAGTPRPTLAPRELDKMVVDFTPAHYDPHADPFRADVDAAHPADLACAETAGALVICMFQKTLLAKFYGELEMGGAVLNILLVAAKMGYGTRIIRNFDRDALANAFRVPSSHQITCVLAIGKHTPNEVLSAKAWEQEPARAQRGIAIEDLVVDRRSIRVYPPDKPPQSHLDVLQRVGKLAPLFSSSPFYEIKVLTDEKILEQAAKQARIILFKQKHVAQAPIIISVTCHPAGSAGFYYRMDLGMVFEVILLEAYALGIGTCWIGAFNHPKMREILQIPDTWRVEGLVTIGFPGEYPQPPTRKAISDLAFLNSMDAPFGEVRGSTFAKAGITSLILRNFKPTDASTILRERDAGTPLVAGFKEAYDARVAKGKRV